MGSKRKVKVKGKKQHKPSKTTKKSDYYSIRGDAVERTCRVCPKCGPGTFMATHSDRFHCGKCSYTEMKKQ